MRDDFAAMILTHGRAKKMRTYNSLKKGGYTGKIYVIIDMDDEQADLYRELYGDQVIQFDKDDYIGKFDIGDNFGKKNAIIFARNASWDIAKKLGLKYFAQFDDDYEAFMFREERNGKLRGVMTQRLDDVFEAMLRFLDDSGALTVAFAQGGDFIGGSSGAWKKKILRKAMNSFFLRTDRRFEFKGFLNEDVTAYVEYNLKGKLLFTVTDFMISQAQTQSTEGGITDIYLEWGTYTKSFYTVMFHPNAAIISMMGSSHLRVHHNILWDRCAPKILNESVKKRG